MKNNELLLEVLENTENLLIDTSKRNLEEDADATAWIISACKNSVYRSYLQYLKQKGELDRYMEYMDNGREKVDNDSTRTANKSIKEVLPDVCVSCESDKVQYHHIKAYRHGGDTSVDNIAPLCLFCHKVIEHVEENVDKGGIIDEVKSISQSDSI